MFKSDTIHEYGCMSWAGGVRPTGVLGIVSSAGAEKVVDRTLQVGYQWARNSGGIRKLKEKEIVMTVVLPKLAKGVLKI